MSGIDLPDQVEVDEAVVHRRHQCVGLGECGARHGGVATRSVDDDEVLAAPFEKLVGQDIDVALAVLDHRDVGRGQGDVALLRQCRAVLEVARDGPLAGVDIDRADVETRVGECHGDVDGGRGLARSAFLVAEHDGARPTFRWLFAGPRLHCD